MSDDSDFFGANGVSWGCGMVASINGSNGCSSSSSIVAADSSGLVCV